MIEPGKKCLISTDNWFYAPDGVQYKAVHGTVKGVFHDEETLGIKTNRGSTNWYVQIGNMVIAGCQIHYAIECENVNMEEVADSSIEAGEIKRYTRPCYIYNAD